MDSGAVNANGAGATSTTYAGDQVTVTDAAGKSNTTVFDALGRVGSASDGSSTIATAYEYDVLDNLTKVTQTDNAAYGSSMVQIRSMEYDSLSRLTRASNPEVTDESDSSTAAALAKAISYSYYPDGLLKTRVDARGAAYSVTLSYDSLGRVKEKLYGDNAITPKAVYCYDGAVYSSGGCATPSGPIPYGKRKLTGYGSSESATAYTGFDALGQVLASEQTNAGETTRSFAYRYLPSGFLSSVVYPSGRTVDYTANLAHQIESVSGSYQNSTTTYAQSMTYSAHGALARKEAGPAASPAFSQTWTYNSRLQVTNIAVTRATQPTAVTLFASALTYNATPALNNGNVTQQIVSIPGQTFTQTYQYNDPANRLTSFSETGDTSARAQTYGYDAFGNVWQASATAAPPLLATGPSWYQRTAQKVTNRLKDVQYDDAGNQRYLNGTNTGVQLAYDAENRLIQVSGTATASYRYDAEGRRVKRTAGGVSTSYIYDAGGALMAEYGPPRQETGTRFLVSDHLGSTRLITDPSGNCKARYDYAPFGAQIPRAVAPDCASENGVPVLFTGKERDAETGLDYFGARYMSAAQGRFTSPDAPFADQRPGDPQSWNLYSYVRNNPLYYVDPTGQNATVTIETDEKQKTGTITVTASIAVYAAPGSGLSAARTSSAATTIQGEINKGWSGTYVRDGVTYTVTTNVTVKVSANEGDAVSSGAQNVIALTSSDASPTADSVVDPASVGSALLGGPDRGTWSVKNLSKGVAAHEWGHMLGVGHLPAPELMNTGILSVPGNATTAQPKDFGLAFNDAVARQRLGVPGPFGSWIRPSRAIQTLRAPTRFGSWRGGL